MFAVADPEEALALRKQGFTDADILLMTPVADAGILGKMLRNRIILTVSGIRCAKFYAAAAAEMAAAGATGAGAAGVTAAPVRVHVAVDTGLGRFGSHWNDLAELMQIYRVKGLQFEGIFSHFSASFEKKYDLTQKQLARFLDTVQALESTGIAVGMRHIANSCAALRFPETRLDAVRIGSALVGRLCAPVPLPLKHIGVFRAMVVDRRTLLKGDLTGYASICKIKRDMDIAVVSIGRQSGFGLEKRVESFRSWELLLGLRHTLRAYRQGLCVEWAGSHLPVIGRIGTQYTLISAEGTDIRPGDYVSSPSPDISFPLLNRKYI